MPLAITTGEQSTHLIALEDIGERMHALPIRVGEARGRGDRDPGLLPAIVSAIHVSEALPIGEIAMNLHNGRENVLQIYFGTGGIPKAATYGLCRL
jgi:hypothetical protein